MLRRVLFIISCLGWGIIPFQGAWGQQIPSPPSGPGLIFIPPPTPQSLLETSQPPLKTKEVKASDVDLEVQTPPGSKVFVPLASKSETITPGSDFRFRIPLKYKKAKISIEGPFGGKIHREIDLETVNGPIKIAERPVEDQSTEPDPDRLESLPQICPRLVPKTDPLNRDPSSEPDRNRLLPQDTVYDGRKDLFSYATDHSNLLQLQSAALSFDSEDASILVGFNPQTGETAFEKGGGFYSNLHYIVLPYRADLERLYRDIEPHLVSLKKMERAMRTARLDPSEKKALILKMKAAHRALNGQGEAIGPYQLLLHFAFNTLQRIGRADLYSSWGAPFVHGFIPGPFLGSRHWGYALCEWGDTTWHAPEQRLQYENFNLWRWADTAVNEKIILLIIEGDDQLNQNAARRELMDKKILRPTDYTDDLIGFFVISKKESIQQSQTFSSPLKDFSLNLYTP